MPKFLPEVFVSNSSLASFVSKELKKGKLRKLASRLYTTNLKESPEQIIKRHAWFLVEAFFPSAVIVDRTAMEHRPSKDGSIFIVSKKKRAVLLPGISIYPRKGVGPLEEDKPFMEGLYLSSPARAYLENLRPSRTKKGRTSRTLSREEIEESLEKLYQTTSSLQLETLRDQARELAPLLKLKKEGKILDGIIGTLLGTKSVPVSSQAALARLQKEPYDPKRLSLFQALYEALQSAAIEKRVLLHPGPALPFFEAYFSNFIEGTEFEIEEAVQIVFEGKIPKNRPSDAHDILGTYRIVSTDEEMRKTPENGDELIFLLKKRHRELMQGRPGANPGEFKKVANRAGSSFFVEPDLVVGTLKKGFQWIKSLDAPFKKAVYMMFLVSEVHPFVDGNGRCARVMMNAELVRERQARIIVPTIFRNIYLAALKALTHNALASPLVRALDFLQHYTSLIDWSHIKTAQKMLIMTHAFDDSSEAESFGRRLLLP